MQTNPSLCQYCCEETGEASHRCPEGAHIERGYRVVWEIEIYAESPEDAARLALVMQRDPSSMATLFEVHDDETGVVTVHDVEEVCA